ncbi:MAG: gliding motility-associated protein GldE [Bacteroidia bacterium]
MLLQSLWPDLMLQFILFLILLICSFLVSGAESAFFSLTKSEIDDFKQKDTANASRVWNLIYDHKRLLATILITNNFANVASILIGAYILRRFTELYHWSPELETLLNILVITSIILLFGEIIPKVYFTRNRLRLVSLLARPLGILKWCFHPLANLLVKSTNFIDKRVQLKETTSLEDLKQAIHLTAHDIEGADEKDILQGIVNFNHIAVKRIMRARVDVIAVDISTPLDELIQLINENSYSRLPVYEESLDNVKGILHIKDLLPFIRDNTPELKMAELLREVHFVPESKKINMLLEEFKAAHLHMAVVVDEFGGTAGIVTLEDIIEEIFGEINDEFDSEDWVYTKKSDDTYIFEGRLGLDDLKRILDLPDDTFEDARGDSDSLGGLILEIHGKIPDEGEVIQYRQFEIHVESVSNNRINQVKVVIQAPKEEV